MAGVPAELLFNLTQVLSVCFRAATLLTVWYISTLH